MYAAVLLQWILEMHNQHVGLLIYSLSPREQIDPENRSSNYYYVNKTGNSVRPCRACLTLTNKMTTLVRVHLVRVYISLLNETKTLRAHPLDLGWA